MNSRNSLWRFARDGLVGAVVGIIGFGILMSGFGSRVGMFYFQGSILDELFDFFVIMFSFQGAFISPMPSILLIGFISMGVGGRYLENITSRRGRIKPILIISIISWLTGIVLFPILFNDIGWDWNVVGVTSIGAAAGFLIACLAGVLFNPAKRLPGLIIGAIASTVVGSVVGFWIYFFQIP